MKRRSDENVETVGMVFGAPLTRYGLLCAFALLGVFAVALGWCGRQRVGYGAFIRMAALGVPLAWLLGRITYVAASYNYYLVELEAPALALRFWDGGYSMLGVFAGLTLAAWMAEKTAKVPRGSLLDALALGLPLGLMVERLAEGGTGLGEGLAVPEGWPAILTAQTDYGALHAVYLYEAVTAAVIFAALLAWSLLCRKRQNGDMMLLFMLLFGCTQVLLESLRDDAHMEVHMGVHVQQVMCAVLVVIALAVWTRRAHRLGACPRWWAALCALAGALLVTLAVVAEFGVDRWDSKAAAYGLMAACLLGLYELSGMSRRFSYGKQNARRDKHGARED